MSSGGRRVGIADYTVTLPQETNDAAQWASGAPLPPVHRYSGPLDKLESIIQSPSKEVLLSKPFGIFPLWVRLKRQ